MRAAVFFDAGQDTASVDVTMIPVLVGNLGP